MNRSTIPSDLENVSNKEDKTMSLYLYICCFCVVSM